MPLPSLRRLALSDLDEAMLRRLVDHGEDLFVERKRQPPPVPGLGAEVASFANTLGGWLLLGVNDDKTVAGWSPPARVDVQSHLGQVLRNEIDPLPPFVADTRDLDGHTITVLRIFETTETPVIIRGTGAVYVRDAAGKHPLRDHRELIALATRGRDAQLHAEERLRTLPIIQQVLRGPYNQLDRENGPDILCVTVKVTPLTVVPRFAEWAISQQAPEWSQSAAASLLPVADGHVIVSPFPRGLNATRMPRDVEGGASAEVAADGGGVIGCQLAQSRPENDFITDQGLAEQILPLLRTCVDGLRQAEAYGNAAADVWVSVPIDVRVLIKHPDRFDEAPNPLWFYASGAIPIPADDDELEELVWRWTREFLRAAGRPAWEPGSA
jgi:hypothetical protein